MNEAVQEPQVELSRVRVRLICAQERGEWDTLMRAHHYLGLTAMVGRSLATLPRLMATGSPCWVGLLRRSSVPAEMPGSGGHRRCNGNVWD